MYNQKQTLTVIEDTTRVSSLTTDSLYIGPNDIVNNTPGGELTDNEEHDYQHGHDLDLPKVPEFNNRMQSRELVDISSI